MKIRISTIIFLKIIFTTEISQNIKNIETSRSLSFQNNGFTIKNAILKLENSKEIIENISICGLDTTNTLLILNKCSKLIENPIKFTITRTNININELLDLIKHLKKLKISYFLMDHLNFKFNSNIIVSIFESFINNENLTTLYSYNTNLTIIDANNITKILGYEKSSLKEIDLRNEKIDKSFINGIIPGIRKNKTLKTLRIKVMKDFKNLGELVSKIYRASSSLEFIDLYYDEQMKTSNLNQIQYNNISNLYYNYTIKIFNEEIIIDYKILKLSYLIPIFKKITKNTSILIKKIILINKEIVIDYEDEEIMDEFIKLYQDLQDKDISIDETISNLYYEFILFEMGDSSDD